MHDQPSSPWLGRFLSIWLGQVCSLIGSQLVQFAIIWNLTLRTGSATTLAFASLMAMLPAVLLSPFIGTWVDRMNRQVIMLVADACSMLVTIGLALLFWQGSDAIWQIYAALLLRSVCERFHATAMGASTVLLVPKTHLARVQGLNQALNGGMNIVAAPLGAWLVATFPLQAVLSIDVITALLAILPLLFVRIPQPQRDANRTVTFWQDMREGFAYVIGWRGLLISLIMVSVINLVCTPIGSLLPLLVTKIFGGGATELGWMEAALSIGIILGGVLLSVWGGFKRRIVTAMFGLVLLGAFTLFLGIMPSSLVWGAIVMNGLVGLSLPIVNGSFGAMIQGVIAPELQGRVFSLISSFATAMAPIGLLLAGPIADAFGLRIWYILGGVVTIAMGVLGFGLRSVMTMESQQTQASVSTINEPSLNQAPAEAL
ncbi:MFS transporter [Herpetosiphon llansteffanensis]